MVKHSKTQTVSAHAVQRAIAQALKPLEARVNALEDEVFPKRGPGPSGLGARLDEIETRLNNLLSRVTEVDQRYAQKTREIIEIVAELREVVAELQEKKSERFRTKEA